MPSLSKTLNSNPCGIGAGEGAKIYSFVLFLGLAPRKLNTFFKPFCPTLYPSFPQWNPLLVMSVESNDGRRVSVWSPKQEGFLKLRRGQKDKQLLHLRSKQLAEAIFKIKLFYSSLTEWLL
ncbi:hypothetical protein CEXT_762111 [Caerostris extrusa]|uniref:Uncharacterized protein n=1 Tax=Caerostris extrusa TaxID=172846 RepID=A0AAV4MZ64_CAEEX|nr:hypothetical protein CEXT_762111 [Caerostris extrusa]